MTEDKDPIQTAHEWLEEVATTLDLDPHDATALKEAVQ